MFRKLLSFFGYELSYVSEYGEHETRYGSADMQAQRPIHQGMSVAPPWAKMRIKRAS